MAIQPVEIHTNRNAPAGANGVYLYTTDAAQELTFGQLMAAVCIRAGAVLERQSVTKMNMMTDGSDAIDYLSEQMQRIADNNVSNWSTLKADLENNYGLVGLPDNLNSFDNRLMAMAAIKQELEELAQVAQEDMIDLQTLINRRDVAMTTSTNLIRALGQSSANIAAKILING